MNSVYLAGPITGMTYKGATDWREAAVEELADVGITGFSPMRGKQFLSDQKSLSGDAGAYTHPLATAKAILGRDYFDCTRCDVLLVNFEKASGKSLGTAMEIAWARAAGKPVVFVGPPTDDHFRHPMIAESITHHALTLEEGLGLVKAILLGGH